MLWPLAFITPPKGEMKGAFVVILSPSRGNFLGSRDSLIPQKRHPSKWMPFSFRDKQSLLCYFVNVIV